MQISGYQKTALESGILKFENNFGLVYLKSVSFYAPEHDPMICWKGSGYTFKSIRKEQVGEVEVYTGILEKGRDKIYSSWWFASGSYKTINQLGWRWKAVKSGENFYLINANAESPLALRNITKDLLNRN
jgi:exosortase N